MSQNQGKYISDIRKFNRFYTQVLGLVNRHILDSPYSLTEARIIYEIANAKNCTASMLMDKLGIDRGYMSRIIKRFEADGLICRKSAPHDNRVYYLCLGPQGEDAYAFIDKQSILQIEGLLSELKPEKQAELLQAMKTIEDILAPASKQVKIRSFRKEDTQHIIDRHEVLYASEYGLNSEFKDYVADAMYQFADSFNAQDENIWIAEYDGAFAGCIALVKIDKQTAQLRWFLAEPEMRGKGIGNLLMKTAVEFCKEKGYTRVILWTLSMLAAARHLYDRFGFKLKETKEHQIWGQDLVEECWELTL